MHLHEMDNSNDDQHQQDERNDGQEAVWPASNMRFKRHDPSEWFSSVNITNAMEVAQKLLHQPILTPSRNRPKHNAAEIFYESDLMHDAIRWIDRCTLIMPYLFREGSPHLLFAAMHRSDHDLSASISRAGMPVSAEAAWERIEKTARGRGFADDDIATLEDVRKHVRDTVEPRVVVRLKNGGVLRT